MEEDEEEEEDEGLANIHPGDMNVIFGAFNNNGQFFPLEGMGGMYPDYDDYEAEEDEEDEEDEPLTASNDLADFENISALMAGPVAHGHQPQANSSSSQQQAGPGGGQLRGLDDDGEDEEPWPRELGEGAMDWKNSLMRALGPEQYRYLMRSGRQLFGPAAASPDRLADLPSPYQRFVRDYPDGALQAFFYDSQADDDEDFEDDDSEEDEDMDEDEEELADDQPGEELEHDDDARNHPAAEGK